MANELLIRLYDVGLGDCIYVRIPGKTDKKEDAFHMLIDCGTWSEEKYLAAAMKQLESELPDAQDGKKRLDLVVVTHEHKDHIAGFDPKLFGNMKVGGVWMNCAMDPKHPQAGKTRKIRGVAEQAMRGLAALGPSLSPRASELLSVFQIDNKGAMQTLRKTLLDGGEPTYVHAGETNETHGIELHKTKINILGPEADFDRFYLGATAQRTLKGVLGAAAFDAEKEFDVTEEAQEPPLPRNISPASFRALRARMQSNALAFAELDGTLKNNSSIVLLIEWNKKRLLFVGDAEWHGDFKESKMNGSWNVMWNERQDLLGKAVDFLKIGHHGSENSTPWDMGKGKPSEATAILDSILPVPAAGQQSKAIAVVSTERGKYRTIPRGLLMTEIARRVGDTRIYKPDLKNFKPKDPVDFDTYEREWLDKAQPLRTDFERIREGKGFIDVAFS
ncbi:MBL fold metallo-hydrolase [Mesorhizobium sp. M1005]|uniref:ComEC/Rec2 family competence protein n=1 Tax=unclassified Mesorhizobium TaxID=325217 RepID=UPI00333C7D67